MFSFFTQGISIVFAFAQVQITMRLVVMVSVSQESLVIRTVCLFTRDPKPKRVSTPYSHKISGVSSSLMSCLCSLA